jgi:hypothetical protein
MALATPFVKTALVIGILSSAEERREELLSCLEKEFGPVRKVSETIDFSFTDYYDSEMGKRPVRYVLLFENLIDPSTLAQIKLKTNELEIRFEDPSGEGQGRRINIDPGILSLSNFILATCKDRSHRIPLRDGIYAETTLLYKDKDFQALPWTYADWKSDDLRAVLRDFRTEYKDMIKNLSTI